MLTQITPIDPTRKVEVYEERQKNKPPPPCPQSKKEQKDDENCPLDTAPSDLLRGETFYRMRFHSDAIYD
jgi:hypothetical protein